MAVPLTPEEQRRVQVLTRALVGELDDQQAAGQLRLSLRQVRRLKRALSERGAEALAHGNRGRRPAHRLADSQRARLVELARGRYAGESHQRLWTLLAEREGIVVARSTLRRVLLEAGLSSPRRRPRRLPAGLVPVAFDLTGRRVELLDLRGATYREPFFHQTVERWRRERPLALSAEMDLDAFVQAARQDPGRVPDGFVFQVGRCGSTLLANMLAVPDEHLVIKESPAVNTLMAGLLNATDDSRRRERELLVELALPFMLRPGSGPAERLLFKLSSWNVRLAPTLLRLFPTTPAVFLYRSVNATVASMLAEPPGWQQDLLARPRAVQARFFPTLRQVPPQTPLSLPAFYAHAWRSAVEAALALPAERLLVIDYDELVADPRATLRRLLAHLRIGIDEPTVEAMIQAQAIYSKDPGGRAAFDPLGSHRRPAPGAEQELQIQAVIGNLQLLLEARHRPDASPLALV